MTSKRRSRAAIAVEDNILTRGSIGKLLVYNCKQCRSVVGAHVSVTCPNNQQCGLKYLRADSIEELFKFRQTFWTPEWKEVLYTALQQSSSEHGHCREFSFHIGATIVCKDFYREVTGLSRQVFDAAYSTVRGNDVKGNRKTKYVENKESFWFVLGFLDGFFSGHRVQHDPTCDRKAILSSTWKELYQGTFKDFCMQAQHKRISYARFCAIRHSFRPGYTIAKTFRKKSGWNHMACDICENFHRAISAEKCYERLKGMQDSFNDHINQMVRICRHCRPF